MALLLSLYCSTLSLIYTLYCWVLSKELSRAIVKVFGMTQPGIETRSPGPLANTLLTRLMIQLKMVSCSLIQKVMPYEFKLVYNVMEANVKGEGANDNSVETRYFKTFFSVYKNLDDQLRSVWPKIMDYEAMLQAIGADPVSHSPKWISFTTPGTRPSKEAGLCVKLSKYSKHLTPTRFSNCFVS